MIEEKSSNKGILVAIIGAIALICGAIITPFAAEVAKGVFATQAPVTVVITATQNNTSQEILVETPVAAPTTKVVYVTATPQAPSPTTIVYPTISNSGVGCVCYPDCIGTRVSQGSSVPPSAILEPHAGSRGILYVYLSAGQAMADGNLWVYVDNDGNPASKSCIEAQFSSFNYDDIQTIE